MSRRDQVATDSDFIDCVRDALGLAPMREACAARKADEVIRAAFEQGVSKATIKRALAAAEKRLA